METLPKSNKLITLTASENALMREYIWQCHHYGFTGINNYSRSNDIREFFYRWHLTELLKKFGKSRAGAMAFITLTLPELKTMQAMFKRVDCCKETQDLQSKFYKF